MLDNANRFVANQTRLGFSTVSEPRAEHRSPNWTTLLNTISDWRQVYMSDGISDTRAWVKPH
jgi:hypothetical protein